MINVEDGSTAHSNGDEWLEIFFCENSFSWISQNPDLSGKYKLTDMKPGRSTTLVLIWKDRRNWFIVTSFNLTVWT